MEPVNDDDLKAKSIVNVNEEIAGTNNNEQRHVELGTQLQNIQKTAMEDQDSMTVNATTDTSLATITRQEQTSVEYNIDKSKVLHVELDAKITQNQKTQFTEGTSIISDINAVNNMDILNNHQTLVAAENEVQLASPIITDLETQTKENKPRTENDVLNSNEKVNKLNDFKIQEYQSTSITQDCSTKGTGEIDGFSQTQESKEITIMENKTDNLIEYDNVEPNAEMQVDTQEENTTTVVGISANAEKLTINASEIATVVKENVSDAKILNEAIVDICKNTTLDTAETVKAVIDGSTTGAIECDKLIINSIIVINPEQQVTHNKSALVASSDTQNNMETDVEIVTETEATSTVLVDDDSKSAKLDPLIANNTNGKRNDNVNNSLSLLAEYISDSDQDDKVVNQNIESDSDSIVEVPVTSNKTYRSQVFSVDSESNSSSASDTDDEGDYLVDIRKNIDKAMQVDSDDGDGTDNFPTKNAKPLKTKGELSLEDLPPIEDLHITVPEEECVELGVIHSIVDQLVLVSVLPNSVLLDLDTVLFLDKGNKVLGQVFDVLGQVADPLYCIRFNSNKQIKEKGLKINDKVYAAPKTEYTQFVVLANLMKIRGSDASWEHDLEPPPKFLDYSDDEEERESKYLLRNKDRPMESKIISKRYRADEESESTASERGITSNYAPQQRGRYHTNKRQSNYSTNNRLQQSPSPSPQRYNSGSWHSNYYPYVHPNTAPGPHYYAPQNYYQYESNMHVRPPPHPQGYNYYPPPTMAYQMAQPMLQPMMPPTHHHMTQHATPKISTIPQQVPPPITQPVQPSASQYVVNPYAIRPPVLQDTKPSHSTDNQ